MRQIKLKELSQVLSSNWAEYKILVTINSIKHTISKTNKPYQLILGSDDTCRKIFYNCKDIPLEENISYELLIRGCKTRYSETLFITHAKSLLNPLPTTIEDSSQEQWFNQVKNFDLRLLSLNKLQNSDIFTSDTESDYLAHYVDSELNPYYLRIWANDKPDYFQALIPESQWIMKNISVNKQTGASPRNLIINAFTEIYERPLNQN